MADQTQQIWEILLKVGIVKGVMPEAKVSESPWYVKIMLAFSGWLAALFLLGFIGIGFEFFFKEGRMALILGSMMVGAAYAVLRIRNNEFVEHLGLAVSLAGQALIIFSLYDFNNRIGISFWLLLALLQAALAVLMSSFVHRVFSSFVAALAFSFALTAMGLPFLAAGVVLLLAGMLWLNEFHHPQYMSKVRSVGYGLVLALICLKGSSLFDHETLDWYYQRNQQEVWTTPLMGEILMGLVMLYIVWSLLKRYHQDISKQLSIIILAGTLILCALSIEVQGITVGIVITLLGFSGSNRILLGLGILSLLSYLSYYYYQLDLTLLSKSGSLFIVGLFLLIARWGILRYLPIDNLAVDKEVNNA